MLILILLSISRLTFGTEFDLGKIDIAARRLEMGEIDNGQVGSSVEQAEMQKFNRTNVGDALNLLSGITMSTNARNEKIISVRGFDSRQVPLFIDGIPVYVPFDGYVDFNRFSTADLSSIQVAKGFSSMAYGPNTLGGAINLISRKPTKNLEADVSMGLGSGDERRFSTNVGSNRGLWYVQTGASYLESESFPLSTKFKSTPSEDGSYRDNAYRKDSKLSVKLGLAPKEGNEYALSYYIQNGIKGQPPMTDPARARYWQWPYWNKQSLYFVSQTVITDREIVKFRLYQDSFDNKVNSFTNGQYETLKTTGPGSISGGKSIFHDVTQGGSLNLETYRINDHALNLIFQYKADQHREFDAKGTKSTFFKDKMITLAAEDSIKIAPRLNLSLGYSQHRLNPLHVYSQGNAYTLPNKQTAHDWQTGLFYDQSSGSHFYTTVAKKNRMPTLKDRYSQRLGTFIENPGLSSEGSFNLELGHKGKWSDDLKSEASIFHSKVTDKIQTVANVSGNRSQVQNIDQVRIYGMELGLKGFIRKKFEWGGNYTHSYVKNIKDPATKIIDVPRHKALGSLTYHASPRFEVTPYLEYNSRRWASNTTELSGFTIMNLKIGYALSQETVLDAGVTNITDKNYALAEGFPSPGRMFFANARFEI